MDLDKELDALFAQPLASFTTARNDLAQRLSKAGLTEGARAVKALKKPTVSAAIVNRLARSHSDQVAELVEIGRALQGDPTAEEMRDASARRRRLVADLTRSAENDARSAGEPVAQTTMARVSQTLYAAGAGAGAEEVVRGRLTRDLEISDLDQVFGLSDATPEETSGESERERAARARITELERLAHEAEEEAEAATAEAERAARAAASAAARAEVARRSATHARERAQRAGKS